MTTTQNDGSPAKRRPGPKARGRTVVALTITVTPAQHAGLDERADTELVSISTIVRRFVAAGLAAAGEPPVHSAPIAITRVRRSGADALRAAKERTP